MSGFLLQSALRRTPVLLDGVVSAACALVAQRVAFRSPEWWRAGQVTGEPAQAKAYERMSIEPLLDQKVGLGSGVGALLALPLLQAASTLLAELPLAAPPAERDPAEATETAGALEGVEPSKHADPAAGAGPAAGADAAGSPGQG
jgi:nicotinate-nucleotide--dimethylbenzimidazole phosphoribosyltransferase